MSKKKTISSQHPLFKITSSGPVYNPPGYPSDLLTTSFSEVLNIRNTFFGGDYNCHLNPIMDKSLPGKSSLSPQAKTVSALCEDLDYIDVWRAQNIADKKCTFFLKFLQILFSD